MIESPQIINQSSPTIWNKTSDITIFASPTRLINFTVLWLTKEKVLIDDVDFPVVAANTIKTDHCERDTQRKEKNCKEMNGNSLLQHYLKVCEIDPNWNNTRPTEELNKLVKWRKEI